MHLWQFPPNIAKKPWLHLFTNFFTKAQKANPPNFAKPKPNNDQFLLQPTFTPHFAYICDTSPRRLLKNHDFTFSPIFLPSHKKPIHPNWLSQNPTKINSICNQTFTPHFGCICDNSLPRLLVNHDFTYSPILLARHKKPIHPTCLSQSPTKINSFCNQTFHTSSWMHLWQFPTNIAQKPWLYLFTNFATKAQKANPPNLAQPKPNQDQFLLRPNFWHLILDAFVTIPH